MKTFRVEPTVEALADTDEAFQWIYKQAPEAALRWYEGLFAAVESLSENPFRCSLALENPYFAVEIRQLIYGRYRVIFTVSDRVVYVLRVRHSARMHLSPDALDE